MNNETINFSERWIEKASGYDIANLSDCFDKFSTLFVAYNALYNYAENDMFQNKLITKNKKGNHKSAVSNAPKYIGFEPLADSLKSNNKTADAINEIVRLIEKNVFYIDNDQQLIRHIKDENICAEKYVESIMELIYQTRCNMFHGSKGFEEIQKNILQPMIIILEFVIESLLKKMKE